MCFVIVAALVFVAIFAPIIAPHDPQKQTLLARNRPPAWISGGSTTYLLGTDNLGYDVFSRLIYGARISLSIGFLATLIGMLIGTALGLVAGFFRGTLDWFIMLAVDAQLAMPFIVIAVAAVAAFGRPRGDQRLDALRPRLPRDGGRPAGARVRHRRAGDRRVERAHPRQAYSAEYRLDHPGDRHD